MFKLHLEREIACSHRLVHHNGKCNNLHGHNYFVEVDITTKTLINGGSSDGMVVDFGDVKRIIDHFDHKHLNDVTNMEQPTAERLAELMCIAIVETCREGATTPYGINNPLKVRVRVHETRGQYVEFTDGIEENEI